MTLIFTQGYRKVASVVKLHNVTQMFVMVDCVRWLKKLDMLNMDRLGI